MQVSGWRKANRRGEKRVNNLGCAQCRGSRFEHCKLVHAIFVGVSNNYCCSESTCSLSSLNLTCVHEKCARQHDTMSRASYF
mmetsp:Transcript_1479/g.2909  ORF Transcript_1479/g.2909 Transcript_1479/m.2909 type:complete len:82 (+) Transcript_1479:1227-1472(+)